MNAQLPGRGVESGPVNVQQKSSGSSQPGIPSPAGKERLFMGLEKGKDK